MYPFGEVLSTINKYILLISLICYFQQNVYLIIGIFKKDKLYPIAKTNHRYGFIISARNEEIVIGNLIDSIFKQDYPKDLFHVFVVADNCTDNTAKVAREHGAIVYERFNEEERGKSFAIDYLFKNIEKDYKDLNIEAYIIFDADNLLDGNYTKEMNKAFDAGNKVVTSFRNSKNFDTNWITAGSAFLFLREARFVHHSRNILNTSTYVSGTGFLIDAEIIRKNGGWIHHTMIEDIEFSTDYISQGGYIAYQPTSIFYDEQPSTLKATWNQRMRWCRGTHHVFSLYFHKVLKGILKDLWKVIFLLPFFFGLYYISTILNWSFFKDPWSNILKWTAVSLLSLITSYVSIKVFKRRYANWDIATHIMPIPLILFVWMCIFPVIYGIYAIIVKCPAAWWINASVFPIINSLGAILCYAIFTALLIVIILKDKVKAPLRKKILYSFAFPLYMFFYLPITLFALFKQIEWKPIVHDVNKTIENINEEKYTK